MVKKTTENKAIFLDRDGVIIYAPRKKNKPKSIRKPSEIKIFAKNIKAIKKLSKLFKIIVITNQPDVARLNIKKSTAKKINLILKKNYKLIKSILAFMTIKTIVTAESQKLGTLLKLKKNIILI